MSLIDAKVSGDDNTSLDSSTNETNQEVENLENESVSEQTDNISEESSTTDEKQKKVEEKTDEDSEESDKDLPFNKHRRWRKIYSERNMYKEKVEELERQLKGQSDSSEGKEKSYAQDLNLDNLFKDSKRTFKPDYKTVDELYNDFRNAVFEDLLHVRSLEEKKTTAIQQKYDQIVDDIYEDIGDVEKFKEFSTWASKKLERNKRLDIQDLYDLWLDMDQTKKDDSIKKPDTSKINKRSTTNTSSKSEKPPTSKFLNNMSFQDLVSVGLKQ